jgi:hypothetical protein
VVVGPRFEPTPVCRRLTEQTSECFETSTSVRTPGPSTLRAVGRPTPIGHAGNPDAECEGSEIRVWAADCRSSPTSEYRPPLNLARSRAKPERRIAPRNVLAIQMAHAGALVSRPPTNSPPRVSQRTHGGRASPGPRFARFATAMEVEAASQDQLFPRSQRKIRRADPVNSIPRIQWLGIGSWALFCVALFVSLVLRPDRVSFQLDQIHPRALVSDVRSPAVSMPATKSSCLPTARRWPRRHPQQRPTWTRDLRAKEQAQDSRLISRKSGRRGAFSNVCLRSRLHSSEVSRSRRDRIRRSGDYWDVSLGQNQK